MQALAARRLDEAFDAQLLEPCANFERAFSDLRPRQRFVRVKVDDDAVRVLEVGVGRAPWVDLQHAHLGQAGERLRGVQRDVRLGRAALLVGDHDAADAGWQHVIDVLLVEAGLCTAIRAAHQ